MFFVVVHVLWTSSWISAVPERSRKLQDSLLEVECCWWVHAVQKGRAKFKLQEFVSMSLQRLVFVIANLRVSS